MPEADDDLDAIAHLDHDWKPLACEAEGHNVGHSGCIPGSDAEWIIEWGHDTEVGLRSMICGGRMIRIRGAWLNTLRCPNCKQQVTLSDLVTVIGPIDTPLPRKAPNE